MYRERMRSITCRRRSRNVSQARIWLSIVGNLKFSRTRDCRKHESIMVAKSISWRFWAMMTRLMLAVCAGRSILKLWPNTFVDSLVDLISSSDSMIFQWKKSAFEWLGVARLAELGRRTFREIRLMPCMCFKYSPSSWISLALCFFRLESIHCWDKSSSFLINVIKEDDVDGVGVFRRWSNDGNWIVGDGWDRAGCQILFQAAEILASRRSTMSIICNQIGLLYDADQQVELVGLVLRIVSRTNECVCCKMSIRESIWKDTEGRLTCNDRRSWDLFSLYVSANIWYQVQRRSVARRDEKQELNVVRCHKKF